MPKSINWKAVDKAISDFTENHASKTGHTIRAWNMLQDTLGSMFAEVALPHNRALASAIWYSQDNDRAQRKMLKSATLQIHGIRSKPFTEIKWVCDRMDGLAEDRNNVVHVGYVSGLDPTGTHVMYVPRGNFGRAATMKDRDLFAELDTVEKNCKALLNFVYELYPNIASPKQRHPWPDRPSLLKRPPTRTPRKKVPPHPNS